MDHVARYLPTIKALAERALDMAVDASPRKRRQGSEKYSLMHVVPAARTLLNNQVHSELSNLWALYEKVNGRKRAKRERGIWSKSGHIQPTVLGVTDGYGHDRPVYGSLFRLISFRAASIAGLPSEHVVWNSMLVWGSPDVSGVVRPPSLGMAEAVYQCSSREWENEAAKTNVVRLITDTVCESQSDSLAIEGCPAPFSATDIDLAPDEWTYHELVALHSIFLIAVTSTDQCHLRRCREVALYHLHHTQPDYTTYQPWALAAFLWFPETVSFAEQQLHDVQTHLAVEGPPGALVPGLLLADAYATLSGLLARPPQPPGE